jgi:hypothetical protein
VRFVLRAGEVVENNKKAENKKWACYNMADLFCDGVARLS